LASHAKGEAPARAAFTMAEILLSLTIIGVVAAITLPSLTGNINERTWNTQRKALYARMSQAIALMPALNGYGTLTTGDSSTSAVDTATETFVTDGLSKVLKINNICDSEHLPDCGIPSKITALNGSLISSIPKNLTSFNEMFDGSFDATNTAYDDGARVYTYSQLDTKAAAFETANGESILVYYNPNCVGNMGETETYFTQPKMCANFVYDLNGSKGPNTVGKDIGFMSVLYPTDSVVVAPLPLVRDAISTASVPHSASMSQCVKQDSESRVPNKDELASMFYNRLLIGTYVHHYWSSTTFVKNSTIHAWAIYMTTGRLIPCIGTSNLRCVKR